MAENKTRTKKKAVSKKTTTSKKTPVKAVSSKKSSTKAAPKKSGAAKKTASTRKTPRSPSRDVIAKTAYALWETGYSSDDTVNWIEAERRLNS